MIVKSNATITPAYISKLLNDKMAFNIRLKILGDYYRGRHRILLRHYNDPNKPNNRIVVNYCQYIADFLTSYLVGVPIEYDNIPDGVRDVLEHNHTNDETQGIVESMNVYGFGAELLYGDESSNPRFVSISPTESIFVLDDSLDENLRCFIRVYQKDDDTYSVTVYTDTTVKEFESNTSLTNLTEKSSVEHFFGSVPAVLYKNNSLVQGSFEQVIEMQDALNKLVSDEINDFEGFVDSYLALEGMEGTQPEDLAAMKENRVLVLAPESKAYWVTKTVNNNHQKDMQATLERRIKELGRVPDVHDASFGTSSGVAIRYKLISTEIQAKKQERSLTRGIMRRMSLLYHFMGIKSGEDMEPTDIELTFKRNFVMEEDKNDGERNENRTGSDGTDKSRG